MNCRICGNKLMDGDSVCDFCGSPVSSAPSAPPSVDSPQKDIYTTQPHRIQNSMSDSNYPKENQTYVSPTPSNDTFDDYNFSSNTTASSKKNRNSNLAIYVMLAAIAVLICFIIVILLLPRFSDNSSPVDSYTNTISDTTPTKSLEEHNSTSEPKPVTKSYYEAFYGDATWGDAAQYVAVKGGYLACINSAEEFDTVCKLADQANIKVFWVGAKRNPGESWSEVRWHDGSKMTFTRWLENEPSYVSEKGEDENYLMVFKVNGEWYFNDSVKDVTEYYSGKMGFIMETETR